MKVYLDGIIPLEMDQERYEVLKKEEEKRKKHLNEMVKKIARDMDEEIMQGWE